MTFLDRDDDTICALTTGAGQSGIAVIRISGPDSLFTVRQLCAFLPEKPESHRVYYGLLKAAGHTSDQPDQIDEVLVTFFEFGKSFTGEETCEISCHGNPVIAAQIISQLIQVGCRPADRGEFTYRAFVNGRIDLVQAESVLSLIEATSKKSSRLALEQLQGQLSHRFVELEADIIWILSRLEAGIDFSTEGIELVSPAEVNKRLNALIATCRALIDSYKTGRLLTDGIKIVLAGRPNAGKSSLLNALLRSERAIVSPVAGTTRDTVEASYKIKGVSATLIDTAGLRETPDEVEKLGVERSHQALRDSDLVLFVVDAKSIDDSIFIELEKYKNQRVVIVLNKIDLLEEANRKLALEYFGRFECVAISAVKKIGLSALEERVGSIFSLDATDDTVVLIHARHEEQLKNALASLERAQQSLISQESSEFACLDLREALTAIGNILGKGLSEDVISKIFKDFCIGK